MFRLPVRAVLVTFGALLASPAFGASPDPKDLIVPPQELSKARELVQQLGSDVYREREAAQVELVKMGRLAKQALMDGAQNDPDPEVRQRCAGLLPKAAAADLQARLDTFMADTEGKYDHDLPGYKLYRRTVGTTKEDRDLYVEMLKSPANMELFQALDKGDEEGGRCISDRRMTMWNDMQHRPIAPGGRPIQPKQPQLPEIAALLFAESLVSSDLIPKHANWAWINGAQFLQQPASHNALSGSGSKHADPYRRIVARWLGNRTDGMELSNLVYLLGSGTLRNFKESTAVLRRIVLTSDVQGYAKGQAIMHLTQQRGKEELQFLREILKGEICVGDYPGVFVTQTKPDHGLRFFHAEALRIVTIDLNGMVQQVWFQKGQQGELHACLLKDVILAFLITQAGQRIQDYGFDLPPGAVVQPGQLGYGNYAFTTEEKRMAAFAKYGWYQMKTSLGGKPEQPKEGPPMQPMPPKPGPGGRPLPDDPVEGPIDLPAPVPAPPAKPIKR